MGVAVALDGHAVKCPRCGGVFPLLASGSRTHRGRRVGCHGDKTVCGATVIGPRATGASK
ncbi:PAAR domain-containing protein [Burkholderia ambifaria]|uniref:PAAR domain-containing protein n=1 Tax=Burkholderia ambifaria TaxID=152480 RepID=UPI002FC73931